MIFKFQRGGAMPPFVSYTPVIVQDKRTLGDNEQETKSSSDTGEITQKDTLKMIQEMLKGLPSDQQIAMKQVAPLFQAPLSKWEPASSQSIAAKYLRALNTLSTLQFNKEQYDKALDIAKSKDSLNEPAITSTGYVYCVNKKDKNDFQLLRPEQLVDNKDYMPITNSDLLYLRANDSSLAFNNQILQTVNVGTSIKEITNYIQDCINGLGTNSSQSNSYASVEAGKLLKGLQDFQEAAQQSGRYDATVQDLYSGKLVTKSQAVQAQQALAYIYKSMPENMKSLLKLRTNKGSSEEAIQLIGTLINSKLSSEQSFTLNLEDTPQEGSNKNNKNKDSSDEKASFLTNLLTTQGASSEQPITIDRGDGTALNVRGSFFSLVPNEKSQEPITNTSVADMLAKSGIQRLATNLHAITFGDQKISMEQLNDVAYLNTGCVRANLPKNDDGSVDLSVLDKYNQAMNEIKLANGNNQQIAQIISKYRLNSYILPNGAANPQTCGAFIITEGYTNDDVIDANNSKFIKEKNLTDDQERLINDAINSTRDKNSKKFDISGWFTNTYKAAIYIPITNNLNAALQNSGLSQTKADSLEEKYQNFNKMNKAKSTSADIL